MVKPPRDLIERLTEDLRPVKPLSAWRLLGLALVFAAVTLIWVLGIYGMRPELSDIEAALTQTRFALFKPLLWGWAGLSALHAANALSRPEGRCHWSDLAPLPLILISQATGLWWAVAHGGWTAALKGGFGGATLCGLTIIVSACVAMRLITPLWLNRTASSQPRLLRLTAALGFATLAAAAYALHCPMDQPYYTLSVYLPAVGMVLLIEGWQGR
ncbi:MULTISPECIES: NrsF family protein [Asticcacaulis]|uniref:NrsF family protein n=1 Tax=Asticcacaulis currens TaxID=2984210 RepID=A0ABT5IED3_9CAUL|nr:NrsF family protein [Asticcacaulis currens]MDC7694332.1 NrsF family protein [Asticcacaulis currens]